MSGERVTLHATCILLGEDGILIRGPSGAGKSTLARRLVAAVEGEGGFAAHVADDRTIVERRAGRLLARPVPAIAGRHEIRGHGIVGVAHDPAARLSLLIDLLERPGPRLPEPSSGGAEILGVTLTRLEGVLDRAFELALRHFRGHDDTLVTE